MLDARCPGCGMPIRLQEKLIDRRARCTRCDAEFRFREALIPRHIAPPKCDHSPLIPFVNTGAAALGARRHSPSAGSAEGHTAISASTVCPCTGFSSRGADSQADSVREIG